MCASAAEHAKRGSFFNLLPGSTPSKNPEQCEYRRQLLRRSLYLLCVLYEGVELLLAQPTHSLLATAAPATAACDSEARCMYFKCFIHVDGMHIVLNYCGIQLTSIFFRFVCILYQSSGVGCAGGGRGSESKSMRSFTHSDRAPPPRHSQSSTAHRRRLIRSHMRDSYW